MTDVVAAGKPTAVDDRAIHAGDPGQGVVPDAHDCAEEVDVGSPGEGRLERLGRASAGGVAGSLDVEAVRPWPGDRPCHAGPWRVVNAEIADVPRVTAEEQLA